MKKISSPKDLQRSYDSIYSSGILRESSAYYEWISKLLRGGEGKALLDVACGAGFLLEKAEDLVLLACGVDISNTAVKIAKENSTRSELLVADGERLPFRDNAFDYVTCLGSLEHFINADQGIEEINRVLTNHGLALITVPNVFFLIDILLAWFKGRRMTHGQELERYATRYEWEERLHKNGLDVTKVFKFNDVRRIFSKRWIKAVYGLIKPLIPLNLSYHFLFVCKKLER